MRTIPTLLNHRSNFQLNKKTISLFLSLPVHAPYTLSGFFNYTIVSLDENPFEMGLDIVFFSLLQVCN